MPLLQTTDFRLYITIEFLCYTFGCVLLLVLPIMLFQIAFYDWQVNS